MQVPIIWTDGVRVRAMTEISDKIPGISIIIPVGLTFDDLSELVPDYAHAMEKAGLDFEIIVALDGPNSAPKDALNRISSAAPWLRVVELSRQFGEAVALTAGFSLARGGTIITLPASYQVDPAEIPKLVSEMQERDDMLVAARRQRAGTALDRARRHLFHRLTRYATNLSHRDLGCTVRIMRREVMEETPLYGEQHRFFPALASRQGFRVREVEFEQSSRDRSRQRPRFRHYLHRLLDVLSIFFLIRFTKKPLRFFGMIGTLVGASGALLVSIMVIQRLFFDVALADRPALLLSSLLVVLGVQIFALGLIGELIIFTHAGQMKEYAIRSIIESSASHDSDKDAA